MPKKFALLLTLLLLAPALFSQERFNEGCMEACRTERPNPDLQRQELIALEKEAVRAIQRNDGAFFRRVYSDDFVGTLSHGQSVDKTGFINVVESTANRYQSVQASDIAVRLYRDAAVASCLWSMRSLANGQPVSSQIRVIHVYLYGSGGFRLVASQATPLPPYGQQAF
jgi:hypothetical protein